VSANLAAHAAAGAVFDFYGTLAPGTSVDERDEARAAVAQTLGCDPVAFAAAIRASFGERARGRTGDPLATMRWLAARCGVEISADDAQRAYNTRLEVERAFMRPRPEAVEVLSTLNAAGLKIGVLSDCTHELPHCWLELPFAPFVDAAVFSVETGKRKPDPAMYAEVCARIGAEPSDCLYVGDGGSNELTGAKAAGFRAIQLRGPEFAGAHTYDAEAGWDGEIITDLREIYPAVGLAPPPPVSRGIPRVTRQPTPPRR